MAVCIVFNGDKRIHTEAYGSTEQEFYGVFNELFIWGF